MTHTLFMIEISVRRITIYKNGSLLALFLIQKIFHTEGRNE